MLAPDGALNSSPFTTLGNDYDNGGDHSGYMEIGGSYDLIPAGAPLNAKMPSWCCRFVESLCVRDG